MAVSFAQQLVPAAGYGPELLLLVPALLFLRAAPVPCSCLFAVLLAEVVAHYFPKLVELHNYRYSSACSTPAAPRRPASCRHV